MPIVCKRNGTSYPISMTGIRYVQSCPLGKTDGQNPRSVLNQAERVHTQYDPPTLLIAKYPTERESLFSTKDMY